MSAFGKTIIFRLCEGRKLSGCLISYEASSKWVLLSSWRRGSTSLDVCRRFVSRTRSRHISISHVGDVCCLVSFAIGLTFDGGITL
ncbi:hypothetical protein QQG55_16005 [Brugia pahangi]